MAAGNNVSAPERTLVTIRVFDAPRELVYRAWTDPKQLAKWFPPEGFSSPRCEIDPRPGGVFREVVPNERLTFTMEPQAEGQTMPMILMTVRFEDQAGKTKLTVEQTLETVADYETMVKTGMAEGIGQSLAKLAGVLSGNSTDRGVTVSGPTLTLVRAMGEEQERAGYTQILDHLAAHIATLSGKR